MKYTYGLFIAIFAILLNTVYGFPAYDDGNDDVEIVPLDAYSGQRENIGGTKKLNDEYDNFDGVVDTGFRPVFVRPYPYLPWNWNFSGFFDNIEDIFRNMRDQVATRWSGEDDDFGKGNTTSKVEIVDGHKITINTTSYVKDTGYGKSVINVRTIDVEPVSNETTDGIPPPAVTATNNDDDKVKEVGTRIETDEKSKPESNKDESVEAITKDETDNEIVGDIDEPQQHAEVNSTPVSETTTTVIKP
jgi:hypothetical protein